MNKIEEVARAIEDATCFGQFNKRDQAIAAINAYEAHLSERGLAVVPSEATAAMLDEIKTRGILESNTRSYIYAISVQAGEREATTILEEEARGEAENGGQFGLGA